MDYDNRNALIKREVKNLLVKFHKGGSLGLTITALLELISTVRRLDERKIAFVLQGLKLTKKRVSETSPNNTGYNEAVEENNFAINLAIDSFKELNDEEE